MNTLEICVITTLSATLSVVCVYLYLYIQYRELYIGLWFLGWLTHLSRLPFFEIPLWELSDLSTLIYECLVISGSFMSIVATNMFFRRKTSKLWYYITLVTLVISSISIYANVPFTVKFFTICVYVGVVYSWTGILFIRQLSIRGWGKYVVGIALVLLGIHILDLPFLIQVAWFAPWGFLFDAVLRFTVATGILIVYFEKTRTDLEHKERSYRLLAENALDVIYRYRLQPVKGFEYISPSISKLTGYTPEEFYANKALIFSIIHPSDYPIVKLFSSEPNTALQPLMLRLIHREHFLLWIEQRSVPIFDKEGNCIGFEGIIRDITARRALEQDVSRLDRLNTVGQMAASVAHEIRNPMTTISGYLQIFANRQEFTKYRDQIHLLLDELNRANTIIKEYLSLSQDKATDLKLGKLNIIIQSILPLIQADAIASNKDIKSCLEEIPEVYVDENEIRQLILNLVRNGLEAMEAGKTLFISTFVAENNREAVLAIRDQGTGIPPHILENLGQPFLTTKDTGTGLGLAVCHRIANRHHAKLEVTTGSTGTTFHIRFKVPN